MVHFRILQAIALILTCYSLFVLWIWTGPVGIVLAAMFVHALLRLCERQTDGQEALARKTRDDEMRRAFAGSRD